MTRIKISNITTMFLVAMIVLVPQSFAESKYYFNIGFANIDFNSNQSTIDNNVYFISTGTEIHPNFDVEVKYSFGGSKERYSGVLADYEIDSIFQTSLIAKRGFSDSFEGFVKMGYSAIDDNTTYDATSTSPSIIDDRDHNEFTYGVGFKYKVGTSDKIRVEYEDIDNDAADSKAYNISYERTF